jgi:hypothetical protein
MAGKECMPVGSYSEQLVEISVQRNATQRNATLSCHIQMLLLIGGPPGILKENVITDGSVTPNINTQIITVHASWQQRECLAGLINV